MLQVNTHCLDLYNLFASAPWYPKQTACHPTLLKITANRLKDHGVEVASEGADWCWRGHSLVDVETRLSVILGYCGWRGIWWTG